MYEFMIFCNYIDVLENCNKKNVVLCVFFFFLYGVFIVVKIIIDVIFKF